MFQGGWRIVIFCFRLKWKAEDFSIDAGEPLQASTLFSTIAAKSQNLSDVTQKHAQSINFVLSGVFTLVR